MGDPAPQCHCPRCGYDQAGAIGAWERSRPLVCPLEGTCSECGLRFFWGDLLNPRLAGPAWSYEHYPRPWPRQLWRAVPMCYRPRTLWSELRLEHRARLWRAGLMVLVAALLTHLLLAPIGAGVWGLVFLARTSGFTGIPNPGAIWLGSGPRFSYVQALREALWPYGHQWYGGVLGVLDPWVAHALLMAVLVPLCFLALPATLRRARVRPRHLARIWLYSLVPLVLVLYLWLVIRAVGLLLPNSPRAMPFGNTRSLNANSVRLALTVIVLVFLWVWWRAGVERYLRIAESRRIVLAMLTIAFLAAAVAVLLVPVYSQNAFSGFWF